MLGKKDRQMDIISTMVYESLIPEDHVLVQISNIIDFSFVYEQVRDVYSDIGRPSKDPAMMLKVCLLEYLYDLSDVLVVKRVQTDVAFRWFLGLNIHDEVFDDSTISHFRAIRLGSEKFEGFFKEIVRQCKERGLVDEKRYIADTTDVAANAKNSSNKKLLCDAMRKVGKEVSKFNEKMGTALLENFEQDIGAQYLKQDKVSLKNFIEIAKTHSEQLKGQTLVEYGKIKKYRQAFDTLNTIIDQYGNNKKDKIISVVDTDARVAHKSRGKIKRGFKSHILIDEESEIILAGVQTPFNVGDEKMLTTLLAKAKDDLGLKPEELTADKVYGTIGNRSFLKDNRIDTYIDFYVEKKSKYYGVRKFKIREDLTSATCPNGITTKDVKVRKNKELIDFRFDKKICQQCPLVEKCVNKGKLKNYPGRLISVNIRYDAMVRDAKKVGTTQFKQALNKRWIVERRFSTMVRNHGLRRSRYRGLERATIHMVMANIACNVIRMVKLLCHPNPCPQSG